MVTNLFCRNSYCLYRIAHHVNNKLCQCIESQVLYIPVFFKTFLVYLCRANGPDWGGHGPDQPGHARCREEPGGSREMLWSLCAALEKVGQTGCMRTHQVPSLRFKHFLNWLIVVVHTSGSRWRANELDYIREHSNQSLDTLWYLSRWSICS